MPTTDIKFNQGDGWKAQAKAAMEYNRDNSTAMNSDGVRFQLFPSGLRVVAPTEKKSKEWANKVREAIKIS